MEKTKNKKCLRMIKILLIFVLIVGIVIHFGGVNAAIETTAAGDSEATDDVVNWFQGFFSFILGFGTGPLSKALALLVNLFNGLMLVLLYLVFFSSGIISNPLLFPTPDNLIYNRIAFFDPNFINPTTVDNAPVQILKTTIQNLYYSMFTIAITIFIIAAMVIGIKLALSSIASEKAQYKEALKNWVLGIVLLFTVHFLMAGVFKINEVIVETAYKTINNSLSFQVDVGKATLGGSMGTLLSGFLSLASDAINAVVGTNFDFSKTPAVSGFMGFYIMMIAYSATDVLYAIAVTMLLFQTIALIIVYAKRLFYCVFLGIMAPLVVAADVIKKSMN